MCSGFTRVLAGASCTLANRRSAMNAPALRSTLSWKSSSERSGHAVARCWEIEVVSTWAVAERSGAALARCSTQVVP
eukprot:9497694-Pyramimonas_sp.AAC.1